MIEDVEREELEEFYKNFVGPHLNIFKMSHEERARIMKANPPEITSVHHADAYFDWSWTACGFGQLSFNYNRETGKLTCMNECMSRESVRQILHALADHIADNVELLDDL